jgi:hypothetical protein
MAQVQLTLQLEALTREAIVLKIAVNQIHAEQIAISARVARNPQSEPCSAKLAIALGLCCRERVELR